MIEKPVDPEEEFGSTSLTTSLVPLCFYYGYPSCSDKPLAYSAQVTALSEFCNKKSLKEEAGFDHFLTSSLFLWIYYQYSVGFC